MAKNKLRLGTGALLVAGGMMLTMGMGACQEYGDDLTSIGKRTEYLEANTDLLKKQDSTIQALLVLAQAIEVNDYVTSVVENADGSVTITFKNKGTITLTPGEKGPDGDSHVFGVRKDTDGNCYWTIDGEWLLDSNGNKIRIGAQDGQNGKDAETNFPSLRINNETNEWEVYDEATGQWRSLGGPANGKDGKVDAIKSAKREGNTLIIETTSGEIYVFQIINAA
ncbi:MAG: hypothetical protein IJ841_09435 [Prevotella sp.]|nr:hypothetical protein [Prevotella sp.]